MKTYCFTIRSTVSVDDAWQELEAAGIQPLYSSETPDGVKEIYGNLNAHISIDTLRACLSAVSSLVETVLDEIDWASQWESHGLDFREGCVHVDLEAFGCPALSLQSVKILKLEPGPGFGDLYHPTTRLVLNMMAKYVPGAHVLDIGCGSGILALAAVAMGAASVHGIDIDSAAIAHARHNAMLNGMERQVTFGTPEEYQKPVEVSTLLVLMNMISSEQAEAWKALPSIHHVQGDCLISGILEEGLKPYLKQTRQWGWELRGEMSQEGWLGLHFTR